MEETTIANNAEEIPVEIKILNKSDEPLNVEGYNTATFSFQIARTVINVQGVLVYLYLKSKFPVTRFNRIDQLIFR